MLLQPIADFTNDGPANEGSSVTIAFTNQTDPGTLDTFTYSFDLNNDGVYEIAGQTLPSAIYVGDDDGTYTVRGRITDDDGGFSEYTTTIQINNVAPTITEVTNNAPVDEGSLAIVTVSATDPAGGLDPLTYWFDFA